MGMCCWPEYGFQSFEFRTGYINQENNVGKRVYLYTKLINSLIQVAINFLERHMDTYRIRVILFSALIRVSSLEQGIKTKLYLVYNRVRFLEDQRHTPTKIYVQKPPPPPYKTL